MNLQIWKYCQDITFENNVTVLKTPLTEFFIADDTGRKISFDIIPSVNQDHMVWIDNSEEKIQEVENYAEATIRIATANLEVGKPYRLHATAEFEPWGSDEHLFTIGTTKGDTTLAVSFPDPNEMCKLIGHEDEERRWYDFDFDRVPNAPVSLRLIDREKEYIYISVAWIWGITDHMIDYEESASLFTDEDISHHYWE